LYVSSVPSTEYNFCMDVEYHRLHGTLQSNPPPQGITHFRFLSGDGGTGTIYYDIPRAQVGNSIQICSKPAASCATSLAPCSGKVSKNPKHTTQGGEDGM